MATTDRDETFENILDLELAVLGERASAIFGATYAMREAGKRHLSTAKRALWEAVDALTPEQMAAYGSYRAQALAD